MKFVKQYDDVLDNNLCDFIINKFENDKTNQKKVNTNLISFTELNITEHESWNDIQTHLLSVSQEKIKKYFHDIQIDQNCLPLKIGYEQFRMKKYLPNNQDEFKFHVDVYDYPSARRFLVFFFYLNDVLEGGETAFQLNRNSEIEMKVQPKKGRLLIFPPMWTHPHAALKPISGPKYIIGGYLHYV